MAPRIKEENLGAFFEYDLNLKTRTMYLGTASSDSDSFEINRTEKFIKGLHILDSVASEGDSPINVIMNHSGGDMYEALAIYDAIRSCKNHITITVYGKAMSSGSIILQAADKRVVTKNATIMIHYGYTGTEDHSKTVEKTIKEVKRLDSLMEDIYLDKIKKKHPTYTKTKLKNLLKFDTYLIAEQALELGLVDEIKEGF